MSQHLEHLVEGVQRTRGEQVRRWLVLGLAALTGLWIACFVSYTGLDLLLKLSMAERAVLFLLTLLLLAGVAGRLWVRPLRERRPNSAIAAEIEARYPEVETTLSTSIEYGEDPARTEAFSSPPIVDRLVLQAADRSQHISFKKSVDWRLPCGLAVAVLLAAAALAIGFHQAPTLFWPALHRFVNPLASVEPPTLARVDSVSPGSVEIPFRSSAAIQAAVSGFRPDRVYLYHRTFSKEWRREEMLPVSSGQYAFTFRDVREEFEYYLQARDHRTLHYSISVYLEPAVEQMSVVLTYPTYTGVPPARVERNVGDIQALVGTRVDFEVRSNVPVTGGQILFKSAEAVALEPVESCILRGQFTVSSDDHYAIKLFDRKRRSNENLLWHSLKALEDELPKARITHPDPDVLAQDNQEVVLRMEAEDDFGVMEFGLAFYVLGEDEIRETIKTLEKPLRTTRGTYSFDLDRMILPPGAILAYYAYALDNDTVNGPKEGVSVLQFIRVYEAEQLANPDALEESGDEKGRQAQQQMLVNLEKMISDQIKVVATTFQIANTEAARRTEIQRKSMEAMAKLEKELAGQVEQLARNLEQALEALHEEDMPEIDALLAALPPLREAGWYLTYQEANEALPPEKSALHHLSQARRLIKIMGGKGGRQQAYMMAMSDQQNSERQKDRGRAQEMQQMAQDMPKMLEQQEKAKRELEELAKQEEQKRERDETYVPDDWKSFKKREELSDELREIVNDAFDMARRMARQAEEDSQMSKRAAERMKEASNDLYKAQRALAYREYQEAHNQAREAEREMRDAERSLHHAMRRDLVEAMKSAAERSGQLAHQQAALQQETEQQAGKMQPGGESTSAPPSSAAKPPVPPDSEGPRPSNTPPRNPPGGELSGSEASAPSETPEALPRTGTSPLAQRQRDLNREAASLGSELEELAQRATESGRVEDQKELAGAAKELKEGSVGDSMARAAAAIDSGQHLDATRDQQRAQESLRAVQSRLAQAASRSHGEDEEKLRQLTEETEKLAAEQRLLNRQAARAETREPLATAQASLIPKAKDMGARARQMSVLADSGLEEETHQAYEATARKMGENQKMMEQAQQEFSPGHGEEAVRQLETAAENLRLAGERSLGNRLAQAAGLAKAAAEEERRVEDALQAAAQDAPAGQPLADWSVRSMARSQAQAVQVAKELDAALAVLSKVARKANSWVAKDADTVRSQMEEKKVLQEMEDLSRALSPSKEALDAARARREETRAHELVQTLQQVQEKLEAAQKDFLATPLERLQYAQQKLNKAIEKVNQMEQAAGALSQPAEKEQETQRERLAEQTSATEAALQELEEQVERGGPPGSVEQSSLEQAREALAAAKNAVAGRQTREASERFEATREHLQVAREGIIERIKRILRKRDIREPGSEQVPEEYSEMVKRYYRVLSEEK